MSQYKLRQKKRINYFLGDKIKNKKSISLFKNETINKNNHYGKRKCLDS